MNINRKNIKINKTTNVCYKNVLNLKITLLNNIQKSVRKIQQLNNLILKINGFKDLLQLQLTTSEISYIQYQYLLYSINLLILKNNIAIKKYIKKLRNDLRLILESDFLKKRFNINKNINEIEIKNIINDIVYNVFILTFDNSDEISNFIFSYIKKFISS